MGVSGGFHRWATVGWWWASFVGRDTWKWADKRLTAENRAPRLASAPGNQGEPQPLAPTPPPDDAVHEDLSP